MFVGILNPAVIAEIPLAIAFQIPVVSVKSFVISGFTLLQKPGSRFYTC